MCIKLREIGGRQHYNPHQRLPHVHPNFHSVYAGADAVAVHREQPHYKLWADFKASGGVVSQAVEKSDAQSLQACIKYQGYN